MFAWAKCDVSEDVSDAVIRHRGGAECREVGQVEGVGTRCEEWTTCTDLSGTDRVNLDQPQDT